MCAGWGPFFFLLIFALPLHARPQALVVLADGLTLADVSRPDLGNLAAMRRQGRLALMSPGLARPPDPVADAYASLGAGDAVRVGDKSQGRMADALRRAGRRTALLGDTGGPARLFLPSPDVTAAVSPGDTARLWAAAQAALGHGDLVVVRFGSGAREHADLNAFLGSALAGRRGPTYFVVPTPPLLSGKTWNSLTPFLALHCGPQDSLTSDTTQTPGLIAARDVAPTLLSALQVSAPLQMTGAAVRPVQASGASLLRMDHLVRLNQEAQDAIFWAVGLVAGVIVFSGLGLYLTRRMTGRAGQAARYGLRILSAWPLALLLAPLAAPSAVPVYLGVIALTTALLALLPSPAVIFKLTALVLVGDGLTGTHLVAGSALSEYALSGIRFYGIGNEYMGVLIGAALLMTQPMMTHPQPHPMAPSPLGRGLGVGLWFALVTFVLSFPAFGAKAGGAVTATATFVAAWRLLQGRPVRWTHLAGSVALGFALVFAWALLSEALHLRRTHLETAVGALGQGRFGYIAGVSARKLGLAVRVALHPGTLLGLAAFAALGLAVRKLLWRQVTAYLRQRPRETAILRAGLWGCAVAVLFNDSGIVAAILILQCLALMLLHGLYSEERDASARA